jgi:acetyltransferase-like isoleucine patch superfamily enzyme
MEFYCKNNPLYAAYDIGDWTYGGPKVISWGENATLKIGKFCSIAEEVTILLGGEHRSDWVTTYPFNCLFAEGAPITGHPKSKGDVIIGNDVWIARNTLILSGVTIHDGAVIGAGSVVTKDVAPYSITAGNPARHIRYRFDEPTIARLLEIQWWNWPLEQIIAAFPDLLSNQVTDFIAKYALKKKEK